MEEIMIKRIVRDNILDEKFAGYIQGRRAAGEVRVIMNPTTLSTMGPDVRAVSTRDGDIFYANTVNDNDVIHRDLINWMLANNYLSGTYNDYDIPNGWKNLVCWQRDEDIMLLSESYSGLEEDEELLEHISVMVSKIDKKDILYDYTTQI